MTSTAWYIVAATMGTIYAAVSYLAHVQKRNEQPTPAPWTFYNARMTGEPRAVCETCGLILAYWDQDDLDSHTAWHDEQDTAQ